MLNPPDVGSMKQCFINGLPDDLVESILKYRPMNVEMASAEDIIEAAQQVEAARQYMSLRNSSSSS